MKCSACNFKVGSADCDNCIEVSPKNRIKHVQVKKPQYRQCPTCESYYADVGPHEEERGCYICEPPKFKGYKAVAAPLESNEGEKKSEGTKERLLAADCKCGKNYRDESGRCMWCEVPVSGQVPANATEDGLWCKRCEKNERLLDSRFCRECTIATLRKENEELKGENKGYANTLDDMGEHIEAAEKVLVATSGIAVTGVAYSGSGSVLDGMAFRKALSEYHKAETALAELNKDKA